MRIAVILAVVLAVGPAFAQNKPVERDTIRLYGMLNEVCRGSSPDNEILPDVCEARDLALQVLNRMNICIGKEGQSGAEMAPHRCGPESLRAGG